MLDVKGDLTMLQHQLNGDIPEFLLMTFLCLHYVKPWSRARLDIVQALLSPNKEFEFLQSISYQHKKTQI